MKPAPTLALHGGAPVRREMLPYARQSLDEDDINAVLEVLRSDWLTTGPQVAAFEQDFAAFVGSREAVAVSNGTAALHAAMHAAGIGPGDEVIWPWRGWRREIPAVARKVLVTLGGGDPDNVTLKVIRALAQVQIEGLEAVVVVGAANPHLEELQAAVQNTPQPIRLESNVTNMPELMAWADVAITAGGSTCWETAFMGLPSLTIFLAENQRPIAEKLGNMRIILNPKFDKKVSPLLMGKVIDKLIFNFQDRIEMNNLGLKLVDGRGIDLVIRSMCFSN